jgi:hypothetical protein
MTARTAVGVKHPFVEQVFGDAGSGVGRRGAP